MYVLYFFTVPSLLLWVIGQWDLIESLENFRVTVFLIHTLFKIFSLVEHGYEMISTVHYLSRAVLEICLESGL